MRRVTLGRNVFARSWSNNRKCMARVVVVACSSGGGSGAQSGSGGGSPESADAGSVVIFVDAADGGVQKLLNGSAGLFRHQHSAKVDSLTDWNSVELSVTGDSAVYFVNGQMVNKVFNIQDRNGNRVTSGPIALQAEHAEVFYRNVRLQVLP
jgi:Domain of Unknown Function (DUF1080)